jgi:L-fuculose-phosphate aldolase
MNRDGSVIGADASGKAFLEQGADEIGTRVEQQMQRTFSRAPFGEQQKIALACRYLADQQHARSLAGQISVRLDDGTFWTNGFAVGFGDLSLGDLVRVTHELEVVEGKGMPNPATRFHMWVYEKRPDLRAIVHTHPPHASALAMTGTPLVVAHMDAMMFHEDVAQLEQWPGVPLANEEGRLISEALGDKNAILLANHGILTAGDSLEAAVYRAINLEHAAELQILAAATGRPPVPVGEQLAREARRFVTSRKFIDATFDYWIGMAAKRHPDVSR